MTVLEEIEGMKKEREEREIKEGTEENIKQEEKFENNALKQEINTNNTTTVQAGLNKMITKTFDDGKDIKGMARDLTYLAGASNLQSDDDFNEQYSKVLGEQLLKDLKDEGKREAIKSEARKQEAKNIRAKAYYEGCKPIFKLLGIEESFGLIPMVITTVLLMIPFLVVSIIRFIINSINSIFASIAEFKKPAFWLCSIVVCLIVTALIVFLVIFGLDKLFGVKIL